MYLNQITIPDHVLDCDNVFCDVHNNCMNFYMIALHKSGHIVINLTKPFRDTRKKIIAESKDLVLSFKPDGRTVNVHRLDVFWI